MIRALIKGKSGKRTILLGLGDDNLRRMTAGQPVFVDGRTVGVDDVNIVIMYGEAADLIRQLEAAGFELPAVPQVGIPPEMSPRPRERRVLAVPTDGYPAGWPLCASCDRPSLDGKATCGDVACSLPAPIPFRPGKGDEGC